MSATPAEKPAAGAVQPWAPGLAETSFDGCRIDDLLLAGGVVSLLAVGGVVRIWDGELDEFQLYSNTCAEVQLDYPGRGAFELLEQWRERSTPVSVETRLWDQQVIIHSGAEAIAATIPDQLYEDASPFG